MNTRTLIAGLALTVLTIGGSACGSDSISTDSTGRSTTTTSAPAASGVTVTDAWARMSPSGVTKGAIYLTLTSARSDVLMAATVPTDVARKTEIHETVTMGAGAPMTTVGQGTMPTTMPPTTSPAHSTGSSMPGQMTMREISSLALPAGSAVKLMPGGHHIMLIDLVKPLTVGESVTLTLSFKDAAPVTVEVPVKEG